MGQDSGVGPVLLHLYAGIPVSDGSIGSGARWILLASMLDNNA